MKIKFFVLLLLFGIAVPVATAQEQLPSAETLQRLTAGWVELNRAYETEKSGWAEQKSFLQNELQLLTKEKQRLEEEISQAQATENAFLQERAGLLKDKENFEKQLEALEPDILRAEAYLKQWEKKIPPSLVENFSKLLKDLKYAQENSVSQHLHAIFSLYAELESLQSQFHVTREFLTVGKKPEQEFEVLYQGLAAAYAVSADGRRAAAGTPDAAGWVWKEENKLSPRIRKALAILKKEQVAEFIPLPVKAPDREAES